MILRFPLKDVTVREVNEPRTVLSSGYADAFWQMNQDEFAMQVEGVGQFYARDGREVEYAPAPGASQASLELYLNGSVYGAILHQRKILPLHGSSFIVDGKGILVCGEAGAGKSSVTASFVLDGAIFLTDDVTPVVMREDVPCILALSDRIKLWKDTLEQLKLPAEGLSRIDSSTEKYYFPMANGIEDSFSLDTVFMLSISEDPGIEFSEVNGAEKFLALRNEIYRWEYLEGMKENEPIYFDTLIRIARTTTVVKVSRSADTQIERLRMAISDYIFRQ